MLSFLHNTEKYVTVFGSARIKEDSKYYNFGVELGKRLANEGYRVVTGGGGGMMEALNRGAFEAKGVSIGFNIFLPHEQKTNDYCTRSKLFKDITKRKKKLIDYSFAFVITPGGFGTLDELFEILTLSQTQLRKQKIVFYNKKFWDPLFEFFKTRLLPEGMIGEGSMELFTVYDTVDEIMEYIKK